MSLEREVIKTLKPLEIAAYLRSRGWREIEQQDERATLWEGKNFELLLPMDTNLRDFFPRMAEALSVLAEYEGRSRLEIVEDVKATAADTVRFRFLGPLFEEHTVPVDRGVRIYEGIRDLLLAAACSALEPRQVYPSRKPTRALEYLGEAQLIPPARGSYLITLHSPVPPALSRQTSLFDEDEAEEPFERRVVVMLASALEGAHRAVKRAATTAESKPFYDEVSKGVSANLCEALANLVSGNAARSLEVTVAAAPSRPGLLERRVSFSSDAAPLFQEAARVFRASTPRDDFELEGIVTQLKREEGEASGQVTIAGVVDASLRRVRIELGAGDYDLAIEAHRTGRTIRCEGELSREGRGYVLRNPRGLILKEE